MKPGDIVKHVNGDFYKLTSVNQPPGWATGYWWFGDEWGRVAIHSFQICRIRILSRLEALVVLGIVCGPINQA